jgi:gliding motility-associated-like protein
MASPDSTTTYTLIVSEGGCTDVGEITIEVLPTPEASYLSSLPDGCPPHAVNFIQNTEGGVNYIWNFGDGSAVSNEDFPIHIYDRPGTYAVTLIAESPRGCADTAQLVTVTVYDTAMVDFSSNPNFPVEMFLPTTNVEFQNLTDHAVGYVWDFGDGIYSEELNPAHFYEGPGTYFVTLTATNALGCHSSITKGPYVVVLPDLFIPNVFSPNGDGINDIFLINYTGSQPFNLRIVDRWGVKVYDANNKNQGWNGKDLNGDDVSDGIYYYYVKIGGREFTGPVTLLR